MARQVDPSDLGRVLSETVSALEQFTSGGDTDAPQPEGTGEGADGLVWVRAGPPGRVTALVLDPRVMRMASATLAEEIIQAVNAALADLQQKATAAVPAGQFDLGPLGERLSSIKEDAARQLTEFTNALMEAQERLARQGGK